MVLTVIWQNLVSDHAHGEVTLIVLIVMRSPTHCVCHHFLSGYPEREKGELKTSTLYTLLLHGSMKLGDKLTISTLNCVHQSISLQL